MFLGNKPEVHWNTLLWVMHRERLNKCCLPVPLGDFVSYISLPSLPGMSSFIISEVQSDQLWGHSLQGLSSKLSEGRMLTARWGTWWWGGGRGWGLQLCPDLLMAEVGSPAAGGACNDVEEGNICPAAFCLSMNMEIEGRTREDKTKKGGRDICRDGRLRRLVQRGFCSYYFLSFFHSSWQRL